MTARTYEQQALVDFIVLKFDQLVDILRGMNDDDANTELPVPGSNSVLQLVVHCCGAMRRWSSTVNRGVPVPRDRETEFTARLPVREVLHHAALTREAFLADIDATDFGATPVTVPAGREEFWTDSCHAVLLHVLEEVAQHLGHAQITRDVLAAKPQS